MCGRDTASPCEGIRAAKRCPAGYCYPRTPLELFDTWQDFPAEQRDFLQHFPVIGAGLLEA